MPRFPLMGVLALSLALPVAAQSPDTVLVRRILRAEDRRDAGDPALKEGIAERDPRVALLARRAMARIRDPRFAARDSLGALPAPPSYPDPAWRVRYRALGPKTSDCATLRAALADEAWPVRLRAADLVTAACAEDAALRATLTSWLPMVTRRTRAAGDAAWQPAAHALVALARVWPVDARTALPAFAASDAHWVRVY
ncbi:MAG: hypothetical protein H3C62_14025, partial [Gemmatimonadaceae bacterium]|nr:hypothetical protein [Gemmatimonadaceae bacterium]